MATIKAPFNFVPLETSAFIPSWGDRISQDVPFEDGVSGCIDISIEAKTPIFVRNGQRQLTEDEKSRNADNSFSHTADGHFFIPGTSIKGELRDILEILSFGKMTQIQDRRFGLRDLSPKGTDSLLYKSLIKDIKCGWLYKDEAGNYLIESCGEPWRVSPEDIDARFHRGLTDFKKGMKSDRNSGVSKDSEQELKSAIHKYKILGLFNKLKGNSSFSDIQELTVPVAYGKTDNGRIIYHIAKQSDKFGTLVMTGQPDARKCKNGKWSGKNYEFLFPWIDNPTVLDVDKEIINDFKTIHNGNYDYTKIWRDRLEKGLDIPVFFMMKDGKVDAIGLSYMFRYPTANSTLTAIPAALQLKQHKDLAECIFGTCDDKLGALKGRVFISPAFLTEGGTALDMVITTLSSPKPSYGPLYVKGGTWMSGDAQIKGRKRYPVRNAIWNNETGTDNTATKFIPLDKGAIFHGKIHFHNLKEVELGSLIAALTFNGHEECFHSLGEAKPLGYGKVKISITGFEAAPLVASHPRQDKNHYLKVFQSCIGDKMLDGHKRLDDAASVKELISMAKGVPDEEDGIFRYMSMSPNEFKDAKSENLPKFSDILNGSQTTAKSSQSSARIRLSTLNEEVRSIERDMIKEEKSSGLLSLIEILMADKQYQKAIDAYEKAGDEFATDAIRSKIKECRDALNELQLNERYETAKSHGDELFGQGKYEDAQQSYSEARQFKSAPEIISLIQKCEDAIRSSGGIANYLPDKLSSLKAYIGRLDKWKKECQISSVGNEDRRAIVDNINSHLDTLSKNDRKDWTAKACKLLTPYLDTFTGKLNL